MISEGGFTAQDYKALSEFIKDYKTAFKLGETITVSEVINNIYQRLNKPKEVVKEVIKTVEVPRQLTTSEIKELAEYQKLQNDYNELVTDYRKLDTAYNKLNTEYNILTRSKTNDDTSECSRVRIDTSENILEAYARKIGYSKSEPEQTDELHGAEEPTQTTSFFRSKGYHR